MAFKLKSVCASSNPPATAINSDERNKEGRFNGEKVTLINPKSTNLPCHCYPNRVRMKNSKITMENKHKTEWQQIKQIDTAPTLNTTI